MTVSRDQPSTEDLLHSTFTIENGSAYCGHFYLVTLEDGY